VGPLNTTAGTLAAQSASDETNVVQFLNQTGTSVLDVDTGNARVRVGTVSDRQVRKKIADCPIGLDLSAR
jgi:hypothetical protein